MSMAIGANQFEVRVVVGLVRRVFEAHRRDYTCVGGRPVCVLVSRMFLRASG